MRVISAALSCSPCYVSFVCVVIILWRGLRGPLSLGNEETGPTLRGRGRRGQTSPGRRLPIHWLLRSLCVGGCLVARLVDAGASKREPISRVRASARPLAPIALPSPPPRAFQNTPCDKSKGRKRLPLLMPSFHRLVPPYFY